MTDTIMPAFQRYPQEAAIIGRLLAGYGELEWELSGCLSESIGNTESAPRTLFRVRGEKQRIDIADALMRHSYTKAGIEAQYCEAISALNWCRTARNQYAHCHWWDDPERGLFFVNLETAAKKSGPMMLKLLNVDIPLLEQQEAFFRYTDRYLLHISHEYRRLAGKIPSHLFEEPSRQQRPKLYNPQKTHPPPLIKSNSRIPPQEAPPANKEP